MIAVLLGCSYCAGGYAAKLKPQNPLKGEPKLSILQFKKFPLQGAGGFLINTFQHFNIQLNSFSYLIYINKLIGGM
jgi:hypothetical protein